ncbi:arylsulfatase [Paenibacillus radicis (ex Xue et al. 2023)]|uniref:Arylsulfatase n=1 Tax=Paenibacillus radicis (ex Xue et al. 2023) TaxID=2972489 RepID=A0ABT1YGD4_9BACL|nr:arylsulfatase [Paenibacillus radicis (ex Xue et al. 2023)]MCR8632258.1 arylsulfatase [Paenibacillus radicis (ex Xue et al. 2023)]
MSQPNIIFILADDLGYGDLGAYGQKLIQTPHLDRMAAEGMRFTRHYSGGPVCGPSRACLMTGQHQGNGYIKGNPSQGNDVPLRPEDTILTEVLKEVGYETACIGKWGLGKAGSSGYPTHKGFDYFYGYDSHRVAHDYYPESLWRNEKLVKTPEGAYSHDLFTQEALDWVKRDWDRPFFLYLAYTTPHNPYNPPDNEPYSDMDWPEAYRNYAAMITRMDRDIGRLLDLLQELKIDEQTLVILTSDHGPGSEYKREIADMVRFFGSSGPYRGMKRDVYDGGIHVPLLVRWPGTIRSGVTDHISAFQDFMPTLAEIVGGAVPGNVDGISMVPTLLNLPGQGRHTWLYWEFISMGQIRKSRQSLLDVRTGWKAVRSGSKGKLELYQLEEDQAEADNLADVYPEITIRMERRLNEIRGHSDLWPLPELGELPLE